MQSQCQQEGEEEVTPLLVLIQNLPSLTCPLQQKVLCKLLSSSDAVRGALVRHVTGRAHLRFSAYSIDRVKAFCPWLSKHGALLASLALEVSLTNSCLHEAEAAIGSALQKASSCSSSGCRGKATWACAAPSLQLCSYSSHPAVAGSVLDQLDSYYLTQLELGRHAGYSCGFALESLTRLARLTLDEDSADALLPALSGLGCLTHLALVDIQASSLGKLRGLPGQLAELQLSLARLRRSEAPPPGLSLGHLTALTKLVNGDAKPLLVQAGDELPPRLAVLHVRDCLDVTPLLGLSELRALHMCASTTPAAALQLLGSAGGSNGGSAASSGSSGSSSLQEVSLCYGDMEAAAAAAPGWPCLPLVTLQLRAAEGALPAGPLGALGRLRQLTRLEVFGGQGSFAAAAVFEVTQRGLADALAQMHALQVLGLRGVGLLLRDGGSGGGGGVGSSTAEPATAADDDAQPNHDQADGGAAPASAPGSCCAADCVAKLSLSTAMHAGAAASSSSSSCSNGSCAVARTHQCGSSSSSGSSRSGDGCSLQPLFAALASLPRLSCLTVSALSCDGQALVADVAAAAALAHASALTSLALQDVGLTDTTVAALVGGDSDSSSGGGSDGLTGLVRLVLDNNAALTPGVLPDGLAARLPRLRELGVLRTGIRAGAEGFRARLLALHPGLHVKSCAR